MSNSGHCETGKERRRARMMARMRRVQSLRVKARKVGYSKLLTWSRKSFSLHVASRSLLAVGGSGPLHDDAEYVPCGSLRIAPPSR